MKKILTTITCISMFTVVSQSIAYADDTIKYPSTYPPVLKSCNEWNNDCVYSTIKCNDTTYHMFPDNQDTDLVCSKSWEYPLLWNQYKPKHSSPRFACDYYNFRLTEGNTWAHCRGGWQ